MKAIDVVYVLGTGTAWHNNEIRFSLRALEKNLKGFRKIWIVGTKPEWIKNVNHIPFQDELKQNADGNIARKVLRVCQEKDLTAQFLFINDDHLVMKETVAAEVPPFHKGDLTSFPESYFQQSFWRGRLWRTKNILQTKGLPTLHFDCHVPMVMDKKLFPEAIMQFDFENNIGYTMKSMYGNVVHGNSAPRLKNEKVTVFKPMTATQLTTHIKECQFLAFNDGGLKAEFKIWLCRNFPGPSSFEKASLQMDPFMEIFTWLNSPERDFRTGCMLFDKYGRSKKIKKYLSKEATRARYMKLEHQLREQLNYL